MGKSGKKPRSKISARTQDGSTGGKKKEKDWSFEDIARSKLRNR